MAEGGGNNTMAVLVVVLVIALIAVFFLWQRDQESKDLDVDIGAADDAPALVVKAPPGSNPPLAPLA